MNREDVIRIIERWLDIGILIAVMDLLFGYQYTGVYWNTHGIFCFSTVIIFICAKVLVDLKRVGGSSI